MNRSLPERRRAAWIGLIWAYAFAYTVALLVANVRTGFHINLNDFWGNYYQAENLDLGNSETLYDGFFPIGYPLLLRYAPFDDIVGAAFALGAGFRLLLVFSFGCLALTVFPGAWALAATVGFSLLPKIVTYALQPAPDLPLTTLAFIGAGVLTYATRPRGDDPPRRRLGPAVFAGIAFGAAGLLRQHGLVLAAGFLVAVWIAGPRRNVLPVLVAGIACALTYSPQIAINLASSHGPFETFQYVNVYKMMHHLDLRNIPKDIDTSVVKIVAAEPGLFLSAWSGQVWRMLPLLLPGALLALVTLDRTKRHFAICATLAAIPYIAAVAMGGSVRADLPYLPWTALMLAGVLYEATLRIRSVFGAAQARAALGVGVVVLGIALAAMIRENRATINALGIQHHQFAWIESALLADGVVHPKEVLSTDPDLYLPNTPPHHTYWNGGWGRLSLYKYAERYPLLTFDSIEQLAHEARAQGISHLVLTPYAALQSKPLEDLRVHPEDYDEFMLVAEIDRYRIYRRRDR